MTKDTAGVARCPPQGRAAAFGRAGRSWPTSRLGVWLSHCFLSPNRHEVTVAQAGIRDIAAAEGVWGAGAETQEYSGRSDGPSSEGFDEE